MADALDAVLQMRREQLAREQQQSQAIGQGINNFLNAFLQSREFGLKRRELDIKEQAATQENELLSQFLSGGGTTGVGGFVPSGFTKGGLTFTNPQQKAAEAAQIAAAKPLSGDTARMFSGAKQGLRNIKDISEEFGLKRDEDGNITAEDFEGKQGALQRERFLQGIGVGQPGSTVQVVSLGFADDFAKIFGVSSETGRKLALKFSTLAENNLRARTGAQAPEPEKVAEELRSILSGVDSPTTLFQKLEESDSFLRETATQIRPQAELPKSGVLSSKSGVTPSGIKFRKVG